MNPKIRKPKYALCVLVCVFFYLVAACGPALPRTPFVAPSSRKASPTAAPTVSVSTSTPPPLEPTLTVTTTLEASPTLESSPTPEPPSATPVCADSLRYIEDVTLPDGTQVSPGQALEKQWRVENNGSCDWDARYRLKLVDGYSPLGAAGEQALYPARAGSEAVLTINFIAPLEPGTYRTAWQASGPDGTAFGDVVYMEILVVQ
jgi:hypothetical protein